MSASSMPGPWSRTLTVPSSTLTSTAPPGGLHLAALSRTLPIARSSEAGTPCTTDSWDSGLDVRPGRARRRRRRPVQERLWELRVKCDAGTVPTRPLDSVSREEVEAQGLRLGRQLVAA